MSEAKILKNGVAIESVAKMLIINDKDEVLILTIGEYKQHPEKSFTPDLPGGQVEISEGEMEKAGVIREALEETGIILRPEDVFLAYSNTDFFEKDGIPHVSVSRFLYVAYLGQTPEVKISWEHSSYEWVPVKEVLTKKEFRPFYQKAIEYSLKNHLI